MTNLVTFREKDVVLKSDKTDEILHILEKILESKGLNQDTVKGESAPDKEERLLKGVTNKICAHLGSLLGRRLGGATRPLKAFSVRLDMPAYIVWKQYQSFMNELLNTVNKTSSDTEAKLIESRYILVYHILKRIVAVALCDDMEAQRDGDALLDVLSQFCKALINNSSLLSAGTFSGLQVDANRFKKYLAIELPRWNKHLASIIKIIKILHAPHKAFMVTKDNLNNLENRIIRLICANLNYDLKVDDLSDDWLVNTLQRCEKRLLTTEKNNSASIEKVTKHVDFSEKIKNQNKIISHFKEGRASKLRDLYNILNETQQLSLLTGQLEVIITATSWALLVTGVIDINVLSKRIKKHWEKCAPILFVGMDNPLSKKHAWQGLMKHEAVGELGEVDCCFGGTFGSLDTLTDIKVISVLLNLFETNLQSISSLQENYNCPGILNLKILNEAMPLFISQQMALPSNNQVGQPKIEEINNHSETNKTKVANDKPDFKYTENKINILLNQLLQDEKEVFICAAQSPFMKNKNIDSVASVTLFTDTIKDALTKKFPSIMPIYTVENADLDGHELSYIDKNARWIGLAILPNYNKNIVSSYKLIILDPCGNGFNSDKNITNKSLYDISMIINKVSQDYQELWQLVARIMGLVEGIIRETGFRLKIEAIVSGLIQAKNGTSCGAYTVQNLVDIITAKSIQKHSANSLLKFHKTLLATADMFSNPIATNPYIKNVAESCNNEAIINSGLHTSGPIEYNTDKFTEPAFIYNNRHNMNSHQSSSYSSEVKMNNRNDAYNSNVRECEMQEYKNYKEEDEDCRKQILPNADSSDSVSYKSVLLNENADSVVDKKFYNIAEYDFKVLSQVPTPKEYENFENSTYILVKNNTGSAASLYYLDKNSDNSSSLIRVKMRFSKTLAELIRDFFPHTDVKDIRNMAADKLFLIASYTGHTPIELRKSVPKDKLQGVEKLYRDLYEVLKEQGADVFNLTSWRTICTWNDDERRNRVRGQVKEILWMLSCATNGLITNIKPINYQYIDEKMVYDKVQKIIDEEKSNKYLTSYVFHDKLAKIIRECSSILINKNRELQTALQNYENSYQKIQTRLNQAESKVNEMSNSLAASQSEVSDLKNEVTEKDKQLEAQQVALRQQEEQMIKTVAELNDRQSKILADYSTCMNKLSEQEITNNRLKENIDSQKSKLDFFEKFMSRYIPEFQSAAINNHRNDLESTRKIQNDHENSELQYAMGRR